jgi:hypothetical protein
VSIPRINLLRSHPRKSLLLAIILLGLLGLMLFDWDEERSERQEERVALTEVPAVVKATIEQIAQGGRLKEIEKTTVGGKPAFTASVLVNGKEEETSVGEDGKVISRGAVDKDDD